MEKDTKQHWRASIPHSSPLQVDARGTAAASLLVLLFLFTLASWHWAGQHGLCIDGHAWLMPRGLAGYRMCLEEYTLQNSKNEN